MNTQEFIVTSTLKLKEDYILTHDILYGQQIIIREELEDNKYLIQLVTLNDKETIDTKLFNKKTQWTILLYDLSEYSINIYKYPPQVEKPKDTYLTLV